ncbi:MAG: aspartate/glutamate racemase family protein, partial [Clostridia bacterium]|nr:aspartate/glutamate racemase family protein [Clostridia bacterium]
QTHCAFFVGERTSLYYRAAQHFNKSASHCVYADADENSYHWIIGMEPALKPAHFARHGGKVIVLATDATLRLEKFERLMTLYGDDVIPVVGKGLVELVEAGLSRSEEAAQAVSALLSPYLDQQIDAIVLGCTHYPFLRCHIQALFPEAQIFDGREGTVMRLKSLLEQGNLLSDNSPGTVEYMTSGSEKNLLLMKSLMESMD